MLTALIEGLVAACPAGAVTPAVVGVGLALLAAQVVLTLAFTHLTKSGPWHAEPGFTAHQLVYLPLAVYTAYVGCVHWFGAAPATAAGRVIEPNAAGLHLAQLSIAELVLWDIPTGFAVKCLRDPIMVAHHVGFVVTAYAVTQSCNTWYALCFFGVVEVSSVFLAFADVFHPKHAEARRRVASNRRPAPGPARACERRSGRPTGATPPPAQYAAWLETAPRVKAVNEVVRAAFVVAYMLVRGFYFPFVVWGRYVPDMRELLGVPLAQRGGHTDAELWLPFFLGSAFSFLQLYWGVLLVRQLRKMLQKPKGE